MLHRNIYLMYAISLLQGMVFYAPIAALYRTAQGVTISQITLIEGISLILCLVFEVPWGMLAERIGYKRTLVVCNLLYALSKLVFWQATDFTGFLIERILLAAVIAGLSGVDVSILYLSCSKSGSQQVFGIYNALQTAGLLFASLVYSRALGDHYSAAGFLTLLSYAAAMLLSLFLVEVRSPDRRPANHSRLLDSVGQLFSDRSLLLFLAAIALLQQTHQSVTVFFSQLQYQLCGMDAPAMGLAHILVSIAGLSAMLSPQVTKKLGAQGTLQLCCALCTVSCLLLFQFRLSWLSVLAVVALRMAFGLLEPLQTQLQNHAVTSADRATALSIQTVVLDSTGAGISVMLGMVAEQDLPLSFLTGGVLCAISAILLAIWSKSALSR